MNVTVSRELLVDLARTYETVAQKCSVCRRMTTRRGKRCDICSPDGEEIEWAATVRGVEKILAEYDVE